MGKGYILGVACYTMMEYVDTYKGWDIYRDDELNFWMIYSGSMKYMLKGDKTLDEVKRFVDTLM